MGKAFLLAEDRSIADPTITRQIRGVISPVRGARP
jgi:hypothetical protein